MIRKLKLFPFFAAGAGAVGFLLRAWLFTTGIDSRGLIIPTHPANTLCFIVTAGVVLAGLFAIWKEKSPVSYRQTFPKSIPAAAASFAAAVGILATVLPALLESTNNITLFSFVLGVPAAIGLILGGCARLKARRAGVLYHGLLALFLMTQLVCQYQVWSAEPQLQNYFFQLLALVFTMLTAYHRATLDNGPGSYKSFAFFNNSSVFFCLCAMWGDNWFLYFTLALWCVTGIGLAAEKAQMELPKDVLFCMEQLENRGYDVYAVGGCVRDFLLGLTPEDYDMCTNATPREIARIFKDHKLVRNGEKHGTVGVILQDKVYEITTFRTEGTYSDSRHPDSVCFVGSVEEDLARRDFTVNAMAYNPAVGYVDLLGGQQDLHEGILRTVGDPQQRFSEDALRILRGMRFSLRFQLTPEQETLRAMEQLAPTLQELAKERVFSELCKFLPLADVPSLLLFAPILTQIIPELSPAVGFDQCSPHHAYDVYTHTAHTVAALPQNLTLRWAGLLHDIGKPQVFTQDETGRGHFYGHAQVGAKLAEDVLTRLKAPTALRQQVVLLIENHMVVFEPEKKLLRRQAAKWGIKTLLQLLALQKADYSSKGVTEENPTDSQELEALVAEITEEDTCLRVTDLAISGDDLLALGFPAGPELGACLNVLLQKVQEEILLNEKDALLAAAETFMEETK